MTREPVTCGCGAVLKDSYPSAVAAHGETNKHKLWLALKYESPEPVEAKAARVGKARAAALTDDYTDDTKIPAQRNDETSSEYLRRLEFELGGSAYDAFVATDAGQALLDDVASSDKEARKAAAKAEVRAQILAAKERDREAVLQRQPGPVVIVAPPTNGKPTKAARAAGVKAPPKETPMHARRLNDARRTELPKRTYTIEGGKLVSPAVEGINRPLKIGTTPIDIGDGVKRYPLLHRNGDIAGHQADNYPWKCPVNGKRIRAASCPEHPEQKAPQGYRADDRLVK